MEFADGKCCECGAEFGDAKPKRVTKVKEPYTTWYGRYVEFVAACPSCGKKTPLYGGAEPEPEPEPEPETPAKPEASAEEAPAEEAPAEESEPETPGEEKGGV